MDSLNKLTLKNLLDSSVEQHSALPALSMVGTEPITYKQFGEQVRILSNVLHKRGIITGDKVAILSENKPQWGIAYFAITTMGAIVVPILPDFHTNEIHHILRHSGAKAIFISEKLYNKVEDVDLESLSTLFLIEDFSIIPLRTKKDTLKKIMEEGQREYAKLKEAALKVTYPSKAEIQEDDIASIIYTSGTTGHSKGVMLTHKNLVSNVHSIWGVQNISREDRFLSVLPLSHSYECTVGFLAPIMYGASIFYLDKPPTSRVLLPALEQVKPTMMLTVPLIIEKIFKLRVLPKITRSPIMRRLYRIPSIRKKLHHVAAGKIKKTFGGNLKFFGIGGALLSPDVELFLREGGFPYAIGYGLTETSPLVAGCNPATTRYRSTGPAIQGVEIKIGSPDAETGEGEIYARGDNVMKGYFKDPERTKDIITPDGWFRTGDLGYLDDEGNLYIKGRLKNMIVGPSGENIYPEEIESVINRSDFVLESLVYQYQNQLVARVHLNYEELDKEFTRRQFTETQVVQNIKEKLDELKVFVNNNISTYSHIAKIIEQTEPFEKTPTKKIKRYLYIEE